MDNFLDFNSANNQGQISKQIDIEEIRIWMKKILNFLSDIEENLESHQKTLGVENSSTAIQNIDTAFSEILSSIETLEQD